MKKTRKEKWGWALGVAASFLLLFILLISSFDMAAYGSYDYYDKEYAKYHVLDDLKMEKKDARYVTEEMMAYLRGNRDDLVVNTTVDGREREFFNDREKAHMADVRTLFLWGIALRRLALILLFVIIATMIGLKMPMKKILPKAYKIFTGAFLGVTALLAVIISMDFAKYFTIFHEIFFRNDLWLLDPETDLLINMLPEGFFMDMAARIGIIFVVALGVSLLVAVCLDRKWGRSGAGMVKRNHEL